MADLLQGIRNRVLSDSDVSALIGTRLRTGYVVTADAVPYAVMGRITENPEHHMTAASNLINTILQFDIVASTASSASMVYEAIRDVMDGFRGNITVGLDTIRIKQCHFGSVRDDYTPAVDGSQAGFHRKIFEMDIWHDRDVPSATVN